MKTTYLPTNTPFVCLYVCVYKRIIGCALKSALITANKAYNLVTSLNFVRAVSLSHKLI